VGFYILLICFFNMDDCIQHSTHYSQEACQEAEVEIYKDLYKLGKNTSLVCIAEEDTDFHRGE